MYLYSVIAAAGLLSLTQAETDPRVQVALTLDTPSNGVSTTPSGRLFVLYARVDGTQAQGLPEVVEWINDTGVPFPQRGVELVRRQHVRPGHDAGPKLVVVDLSTNQVKRVYNMANVTESASLLDDIRFNPATGMGYLTDAGVGALIVLDLDSGRAIRVLDGDESTGAFTPPSGEGTLLRSSTGGVFPASGGMFRIETQYLDAAFYNSSLANTLAQYVEPFALTPSTGGTAIDAEGSIYVSDTDRQAIEKVYANGTRVTVVRDERLLWVDAMWISSDEKLWMPAAQLNRGVPFSPGGVNRIVTPLHVYTVDIGVGPSGIDHA
ncbi:putative major royal jelly protein [Mycena venus]|uniref:Putative major royal jelly protein n=1 Tax=Mycena venus TaxID=2733690 RepID=A0A8H6X5T1_9AGAR|nr:putative major royal jelly protein [Mycena venus]